MFIIIVIVVVDGERVETKVRLRHKRNWIWLEARPNKESQSGLMTRRFFSHVIAVPPTPPTPPPPSHSSSLARLASVHEGTAESASGYCIILASSAGEVVSPVTAFQQTRKLFLLPSGKSWFLKYTQDNHGVLLR